MTYEDAIILAVKAHAGQVRKMAGDPYIVHPLRVSRRAQRIAREWGMSKSMQQQIKIIAVLHDVVEDAPQFWDEIQTSFTHGVPQGVATLTRSDGWSYKDYIDSFARKDPAVIVVKLADLEDNLSDLPADLPLRKRYERAQKKLQRVLRKAWTE